MISKIIITDLSKAQSYAYGHRNEYDIWVSVVDEEDRHKVSKMKRMFDAKGIKHFCRFFYDWSDEDCNDPFIKDKIEYIGPQQTDVDNIIKFLSPYVSDDKIHNLGINCFAGVSRSTAVGIIALVMAGKTPQMAFDYVLSIRPQAWPNLRILRFASNKLGFDLTGPVRQWKNDNASKIYLP
jgi:predicted protein tyrosine phosphatase